MVQILIVGLVWLALTAVLCLVIGRALRTGDLQEERARNRLMALPPAGMIARSHGEPTQAGPFAPEPASALEDDELVRWGELWRWEDELRRSVDLWCGDQDAEGGADGPRPSDPDDRD